MDERKISSSRTSSSRENSLPSPLLNQTTDETNTKLIQNSREFIEENIEGALVEWLKEQSFYKEALANDKDAQVGVFKKITNNLILAMESPSQASDIDVTLLKIITNHVQELPIDHKIENSQHIIDQLPILILNHIKDLKLLHNISQRESQPSVNYNVRKWLEDIPLREMDSKEKLNYTELKDQFLESIQNSMQYESIFHEEVKKFLTSTPLRIKTDKEKQELQNKLEESFMEIITKKPRREQLSGLSNEFIVKSVEEWVKTLKIPSITNNNKIDQDLLNMAKNDMINNLSNRFVYTDEVPYKTITIFKNAVNHFLNNIHDHTYKEKDIDILAKSLQDTLKENSRKYTMQSIKKAIAKTAKKKAAATLIANISEWVQKLPIETNHPDRLNRDKIKLQIEMKLIHKIGEINMDNEVFNDDFLYENVLEEEIDNFFAWIESISRLSNQDNKICQLKESLLEIILKARQSIQDENINNIYKQNLQETIVKILPKMQCTDEAQASLEVLKNNVADAFISMRYAGSDTKEKDRLRKNINNEINIFCNNYLNRCPATPLNTQQLSQDMLSALNKIIKPGNEYFLPEVEIIRLKQIIKYWVQELPLKEQDAFDILHTNKIISCLAKKLYDIENDKDVTLPLDYDNKIRKEINKFIKKQPLKIRNDKEIEQLVDNLVKKISSTEKLRKTIETNDDFMNSSQANETRVETRVSCKDSEICSPTNRLKFGDCSLGLCLESNSLADESDATVQVPQGTKAVGSQMCVDPVCECKDVYCRTCDKCDDPPLNSARISVNTFPLPCAPKCPQDNECFTPRPETQCTQNALKACLITKAYPPLARNQLLRGETDRQKHLLVDHDDDDIKLSSPFESISPRPEDRVHSRLQKDIRNSIPVTKNASYSTSEKKCDNGKGLPGSSLLEKPRLLRTHDSLSKYAEAKTHGTRTDNRRISQKTQAHSRQTDSQTQYDRPHSRPRPQYIPRKMVESQYVPCQQPSFGHPSSCSLYSPLRASRDPPFMVPRYAVPHSPSNHFIRPPRRFQRVEPLPMDYDSWTQPSVFRRPINYQGSVDQIGSQGHVSSQRQWAQNRTGVRPWDNDEEPLCSDEEFVRDAQSCSCQQRTDQGYEDRY